jgi:hypothetical protein
MESKEKDRMILSIAENLDLCEWLIERGLGLDECACVLCEMECGDTFALALARVFQRREKLKEKLHEKTNQPSWDNPLTP